MLVLLGMLGLFAIEAAVLFALGMMMAKLQFRLPASLTAGIAGILNSWLLCLKAKLLVGEFFWSFGLIATVIGLTGIMIGLILQVFSGTMSRTMNEQANLMNVILNSAHANPFRQSVYIASVVVTATIMFWVYFDVRDHREILPQRVPFAMFVYFTLGALNGLIVASINTIRTAPDATVGPVVRNILAISSLNGWALQAWRAAFPFFFLASSFTLLGVKVELSHALIMLAGLYVVTVLVPVVIGSRLYTGEKDAVWLEAQSLFDRVAALEDVKMPPALKAAYVEELKLDLDDKMIGLIGHDKLLKAYALNRWGPKHAFEVSEGSGLKRGMIVYELQAEEAPQPGAGEPDASKPGDPMCESYVPDLNTFASVPRHGWLHQLLGPSGTIALNKQLDGIVFAFARMIPRWIYRARVFDEFIRLRDELEAGATENAAALSRLSKLTIQKLFVRTQNRSILTATLMTFLTAFGSASLSLLQGGVEDAVGRIRPAQAEAAPPDASPAADRPDIPD